MSLNMAYELEVVYYVQLPKHSDIGGVASTISSYWKPG